MRRYSRKDDLSRLVAGLVKVAGQTAGDTTRRPTAAAPAHRVDVRLSAKDRQELVDAYAAGLNAEGLAARFGLSKAAVLAVLRAEGAPMRRQSLTTEQVKECVCLYRAGLGIREVAAELGAPKTTVQNALAREGVQMRVGGRMRRAG